MDVMILDGAKVKLIHPVRTLEKEEAVPYFGYDQSPRKMNN
jgi:hypothetical protein